MKWQLKSCLRCGGDLFAGAESRLGDLVCLQCGAVFYEESLSRSFAAGDHPGIQSPDSGPVEPTEEDIDYNSKVRSQRTDVSHKGKRGAFATYRGSKGRQPTEI